MPYWRLFYHVVWATRERASLITPKLEDSLYAFLTHKGEEKRAFLFAVNGMPDHVHVVAAVPPACALSEFIKHLKGASSHFIRGESGDYFAWQGGYGIFSISERNLPIAVRYVEQQKQHHREGTTIPRLERTTRRDEGPPVATSASADMSY